MITRTLGLMGIAGVLYVIFEFETAGGQGGVLQIFHWPAMLLTAMGPIFLVVVCFDWRVLMRTTQILLGPSSERRSKWYMREAILLHRWAEQYYKEGANAFEKINIAAVSPFVNKVIERLAVRMPTRDIRDLLEMERDRHRIRLIQCLNVLNVGVRVCPSLGMLGTILGMVRLLSTLEDPSKIGPHMSLAMLTTFYGLFFSLVAWTPVQQKIERVLDIELEAYDQVIHWLDLLEKRKPVTYFADTAEIPEQAQGSERQAA